MSLHLIELEIRRFLSTSDPEVLCIVGGWGVGKTYAWKKYLEDAVSDGTLASKKYSYVSLFGLNSLDELRFAVVQNTVTGDHVLRDPDVGTFGALFAKGSDLAKKLKPAFDLVLAASDKKGVGDVLKEASFLAVRNQLVCFDDLERAGGGLEPRDTLGLASNLKEARKCKVVLLLNEEQMSAADRAEFNRQLEKVADVSIRFDLSPQEATQIALPGNDELSCLVKQRATDLAITNIRVIRKIDRLARRLADILGGFDKPIVDQAVNTLVPSCLAVYQPGSAPTLDELRTFNNVLEHMRRADGQEREPNPWSHVLEDYPFVHADEMDLVVIDGASGGYFDEAKLRSAAERVQSEMRRSGQASSLSRAWQDLYHGSLATDDAQFLNALCDGAVETIGDVSFTNINSAIYMLREFEGHERADDLVQRYMEAHDQEKLEFFDLDRQMFDPSDRVDDVLREAFIEKARSYVDPRDPADVLSSLAEGGWNDEDLLLMSKKSADDFEKLFEDINEGPFRKPIKTLLAMGRSSQRASPGILKAVTEALARIAQKSPIRERKVRALGVSLQGDEEPSTVNVPEPHDNGQATVGEAEPQAKDA